MDSLKAAFQRAAERAGEFMDGVRDYPYRERAVHIIYDTPAEIGIGAIALAATLAAGSYYFSDLDADMTPTAYSEFGKTAKEFAREGKEAPVLTRAWARPNDFYMKPHEANNYARKRKSLNHKRAFAQELEFKMEGGTPVHRTLEKLAAEIPRDAEEALKALSHIEKAAQALPPVRAAFAEAWDEDHDHHYHTEYETVCTGEGKDRICHEEAEEVYDGSTHTYTFHPHEAGAALMHLDAFLGNHPDVSPRERLVLAKETAADNEYAIETSMKELLKGNIVTPAQALDFANIWATGSNLAVHAPAITDSHASLKQLRRAWRASLMTARTVVNETNSKFDEGPGEFQLQGRIMGHTDKIMHSSAVIMNGLRTVQDGAPVLARLARECVDVELNGKKGGDEDACEKTLDESIRQYKAHYARGLDVDPFSINPILAWGFAGLVIGAVAGAGVDNLLNKKRRNHTLRNFPNWG